ncbi:histone-lysine N-methyltransferase SETMAR-like [Stegodyphus dumicola]|uniref:histone-lysine N-methyltransferase SETMAR-like n=1 Tax=Stegodyphus dumicola TaxID=202533 RepID=UPI0015A9FF70|nr:histone-lysine N-methyltransferase SETMAR-like [Stegodyphus dumicola]
MGSSISFGFRNEIADLQLTGRLSITQEQTDILSGLLTIDRRWTVRELSLDVGLSHQTVWRIMKKSLNMRKLSSLWVPHRLTEVQKWHWYALTGTHLEGYHNEGDAFLQRIVAIDETWARAYEPELKRQSNELCHQCSPRPQKFRQEPSRVKVMLIMAYDWEGVILTHAAPEVQTVNADYYCRFLQHHLPPAMRRKCSRLLHNNLPIVLHNNARCHVAHNATLLLLQWQWEIQKHPPYSPDMSPCDFDLFPKLKEPLRGHRFPDVSSVLHAVERSVAHINNQHLATGLQRLPDISQKVISFVGSYIEGI